VLQVTVELKMTQSLSEDFKLYFEQSKNKDVLIKTNPMITAHSQILCARSEYFSKLLSSTWATRENGFYIINCP